MEKKNLTGYPSIDKPWLKYYSEEAIKTDMPKCTIYDYLYESNKNHLGNIALEYMGKRITYGKLFENIDRAAKAFWGLGVKQGDIVTMCTVTTPETIYALYGLNRLGAIANMVDPRTSVEGIRHYIEEVHSKVILGLDVAFSKLERAVNDTSVEKIIVTTPADSLPQPKKALYKLLKAPKILKNANTVLWHHFLEYGTDVVPIYTPYCENSCCVIVHTGGTTGNPKGVMLSNDNINAMACQSILTNIPMRRDESWLNIMPPFIAYGIGTGLHVPLVVGMKTILIPQFDASKFADYLNKYRPNHMVGVPSHYGNIIANRKMKRRDLSYIIAPCVGGDTMDVELEERTNEFLREHRCQYKIQKGYGMTEVSAAVSICLSNECNKVGSVGVPFPHTIISIFDPETEEELPYGEQGEICITGPNTMLGYYDNPEATKAILKVHDDGRTWVHSGDIGYMTKDGFLFVIDRIKRMIIRHDGFKVFPSLIESVISKSKDVNECTVVGSLDNDHSQGKLPIAYVTLYKPDADWEYIKMQLTVLCKKELPEYAQPIDFVFLDKMPLTPIGKVDFRALEQMAAASAKTVNKP